MDDIERAIAQMKGKAINGSGSRREPMVDDESPKTVFSTTARMTDVDIDIGSSDSDRDYVVRKMKDIKSLYTCAANGSSLIAPDVRSLQDRFDGEIRSTRFHELPLLALVKAGFITPDTRRSKITEEYRRIKRPLLKRLGRSRDDSKINQNVIAVTSAMAGEGKTFSAINLAMSLSQEKDRQVLLIDADVVRHTAGELFGVSTEDIGLLDLLDSNDLDLSDVVLTTNVARLSFLSAGRKHEHASELLSSDKMTNLISSLSSLYDNCIIVVDCPPIMQTNEAAILVDHAGQIVFVVAEEQTSQGVVAQALHLIGSEEKVGVLLNKSTTRLGHYDYYSYAYS